MSGVLPIWPSSECADWMAVLGATGTMCGYLLIVEIRCKVCQRKGIALPSVLEADGGREMQKKQPRRGRRRRGLDGCLWLLLEFDHHHFHGLVAEILRQVLSSVAPNRIVSLA